VDPEDILTSLELLKGMKPYQKKRFFESPEGRDFIKSLPNGKGKTDLIVAVGLVDLEKGMSIVELSTYSPETLSIPEDRTRDMMSYPDKRLNSDIVLRAILAKVMDPQQYWTKQSDLCHEFRASPESIEAALLCHVGEGRVAFEKTADQMLFART
jgi:hypothetical protein